MCTQCCLHKSTVSAEVEGVGLRCVCVGETREKRGGKRKERWGNYGTQMCVIGGSLGSRGCRVQRKADYCSPSGQPFINKHGESPRRRVLV